MSESKRQESREEVERFNVAMNATLAARVDAAAKAAGTNRSAEVRDLACRGLAAMLRDSAQEPDEQQVDAVDRDILPTCARILCDDPSWLDVTPPEVRTAMAAQVASAAAGLDADLPQQTLVSAACVLAADPASPWMLSARTRKAATA